MNEFMYEVVNNFTNNATLINEPTKGVATTCSFETIARIRNHLIHLGINPAIISTMPDEWILIAE